MLTTSAAISDGNKAASDTLSFTELVTLTGVADATSLTVTDFGGFYCLEFYILSREIENNYLSTPNISNLQIKYIV